MLTSGDPGDGDDVARFRRRHFHALQAVETQHLQNSGVPLTAVAIDHADLLVGLDAAALHASDSDDSDVGTVIQRRNPHLESHARAGHEAR